jgi:tagaturonate reductase
MERLNRLNAGLTNVYPERIIQFGEGNFLRAFVDWMVNKMNKETEFNASVVVVQPLATGMIDMLNEQDGLYHVNLQGLNKGETVNSIELIDVISRSLNPYAQFDEFLKLAEQPEMRFIFSNTTEAGIAFDPECKLEDAPAISYPGKLTQLLYHRFKTFKGDKNKGLLIFPCELIFHNGTELKKTINQYIELWNLETAFKEWFDTACGVYSTLVDRIVPGYPKETINDILEKIQFEDKLVVQAEIFHLFVIEAPKSVAKEFPADKAGLNVLFVPDEKPYHERKVTLLNGPHTVLAPVGYLSGLNIVKECLRDEVMSKFVYMIMYKELIETLDLPKSELKKFSDDVLERFNNPFVHHLLTSIMLNSFPKFKTRDLPGLKTYLERKGILPSGIVLGLAAIITYYKGGKRGKTEIVPNDDKQIVDLLKILWSLNDIEMVAKGVLAAEFIWGENLNSIPGLHEKLVFYLKMIDEFGMKETVRSIVSKRFSLSVKVDFELPHIDE